MDAETVQFGRLGPTDRGRGMQEASAIIPFMIGNVTPTVLTHWNAVVKKGAILRFGYNKLIDKTVARIRIGNTVETCDSCKRFGDCEGTVLTQYYQDQIGAELHIVGRKGFIGVTGVCSQKFK